MIEAKIIFTPHENMQFAAIRNQLMRAAAPVPMNSLFHALLALVLGVVGYVEYELIYEVFEYLSGDSEYYSPGIMALASMIMVVGFHVLAALNPNSFAARAINAIVGYVIPVYLLGVGLLLACVMFADGLGEIVAPEIPIVIGELTTAVQEKGFVDSVFQYLADPLSVLLFSLGMGGLAIVNLFVANALLERLISGVRESYARLTDAKAAQVKYRTIQRTQKDFGSNLVALADNHRKDDDAAICEQIAVHALNVIDDALQPHRDYYKKHSYAKQTEFSGEMGGPDLKQMAKDIAAIDRISVADIEAVLKPYNERSGQENQS